MPRALPLLVVAVLTPAGIWHVGAPGLSTAAYADPAVWAAVVDTGQASERRIVGRGPDSRGTMPASARLPGAVVTRSA